MRTAETVLAIIRERGRRGLPLEDVYRQLYNPELYLNAYAKIYHNQGAMTPGVTTETADGMSREKIASIIEALRYECYRWMPTRRVHIPKKHGKTRPLGLPTWSDKVLQEVIREILEAYYEPQFGDCSHGFRPGRGCHTALWKVYRTWKGTAWFIEGDIKACFDNIDHKVLLSILGERIHDNRFLRLVSNLLEAGYLEGWRYNRTFSGTPQGGVVSPILANIYLDRLDKFVEHTLLPKYNRGNKRGMNPEYTALTSKMYRARKAGRKEEAAELDKERKHLPSHDPDDPDYRRLRYVRYADDFLLGFAGPRSEAEEIRQRVGQFLRDELKLEMSEAKTLITHARTGAARFLGYEIAILQDDAGRDQAGKRTINGQVALRVPEGVIREKCKPYLRGGKPAHRMERTHDSVYDIVVQYQAEYRGVAEYYKLAYNRTRLSKLRYTMEVSLTKTLAAKLRTSVRRVYKRYGAPIVNEHGTYKGLEVKVEREDKPPLVARWGGITLKRTRWTDREEVLDDSVRPNFTRHSELIDRLLRDTCELCGSQEHVQMHHIRKLSDLKKKGRAEPPRWVVVMANRRRKTLAVCHECHVAIHTGRIQRPIRKDTGEPDAGKLASPVRRGADGKVSTPSG